MKLGMPTLIEIPDLAKTVELCLELGLDFIELNMNMPQFCPESLKSSEIRKISRETGLEFSLHLPEETDLATFHNPVRLGHIERCKEAIIWAGEAGISLLNLHINNGVFFRLPDREVYIYAQNTALFMQKLKNSFVGLYELARQRGIILCVENCGDFSRKHIAEAVDTLLQNGLAKLTWDVGHDAKAGFSDSDFIRRHIIDLNHMHLHDGDEKSNHQVLFTGKVDINEMIGIAMQNNLSVVIEVKAVDALRESVKKLGEKWGTLLNNIKKG